MWPSLTNCLHYLIEQKKPNKKTPLKSYSSNRKTFVPVVFWSKILWSILGNIDFSFNIQPLASLLVLSRVVWRERGKYSVSSQLIIMSEAQSRGKKGGRACDSGVHKLHFYASDVFVLQCVINMSEKCQPWGADRKLLRATLPWTLYNLICTSKVLSCYFWKSVVICVISLLQLEMKKKSAFSVIITVKSLFSYFVA